MAHRARIDLQQLFDGPAIPILFVVTAMAVVVIVTVLANQWRRVRIAETEATIKARMIDRGFSPDEIERVLRAGVQQTRRGRRRPDREGATGRACCA